MTGWSLRQYRDLTLVDLPGGECLVIACDSTAAIGAKPGDHVAVVPEWPAAMAVRVVMMETLAVGATPQVLVHLSGNERQPTSDQYLAGIRAELELAGYPHLGMNGSTEENMPTSMSSQGFVLLSRAKKEALRIDGVQLGDRAYQLAQPYVGADLIPVYNDLFSYGELKQLLEYPSQVLPELVPIGSQGALAECQQVAQVHGLRFDPLKSLADGPASQGSAGPATSFLLVTRGKDPDQLGCQASWWQELGRFV